MKKIILFLLLPLLFAGTQIVPPEPPAAEAARLGGGRSFGGGSGFGRSAPAPRNNALRQSQSQTPGAAALSPRLGGGFLGPLLAGSLLGSLFFGGAFSGLGGADLLLVGLALYLGLRFLRRRSSLKAASRQSSASLRGQAAESSQEGDIWNLLRGNSAGREETRPYTPGGAPSREAAQERAQGNSFRLPPDFDLNDFMDGAKIMYARLQESWDKRDLEDISQFTTPAMFREIKTQFEEDPRPGQTDILTVQAELYSFASEEERESAAVYFDALLREYAGKTPENAREVWHFVRPKGGGTWKLNGIQQVEG
ncbi:MAG: 39S ribosomal protein L45 [Deltaproteobacteria bacterium]|jgi:predicted lipid-binding transport protein (Tim44 family)|nr:39S ribosomal protein L45 [Deltaproteobacteria bacterium]